MLSDQVRMGFGIVARVFTVVDHWGIDASYDDNPGTGEKRQG
jgi:hypothetical protein